MKIPPTHFRQIPILILHLITCCACAQQKPLPPPAAQIPPAAPEVSSPPQEKTFAQKLALALPQLASLKNTSYLDEALLGKKYLVITYTNAEDELCQQSSWESGDQISFLRVAVLIEEPTELKLVAKSQRLEIYGIRDDLRVQSKKDLIEIIHNNKGSHVSTQSEVWKFKLKFGRFQLIGHEDVTVDAARGENDEYKYSETGKSINFATMQVIDWRKLGADTKEYDASQSLLLPFRVKSILKYKEFPRRLIDEKQFTLEGFNFKDWQQWHNTPVCGFVRDNFTYWNCTQQKHEQHLTEQFSCGPPYRGFGFE